MFWVVDNFLMKKGRTKAKLEEREVGDDPRGSSKVRYRRALSHDESESEVTTLIHIHSYLVQEELKPGKLNWIMFLH